MRRLVVKERKRTMVFHPSIPNSTHWTKEGPFVVWFEQLTKCLSWALARSLIQEKSKSLYWWMENTPFYRNSFWDRMVVRLQGNYHANSQGERKKGRQRKPEQVIGWKIHSNSSKGLNPLKACTLTIGRSFSHWLLFFWSSWYTFALVLTKGLVQSSLESLKISHRNARASLLLSSICRCGHCCFGTCMKLCLENMEYAQALLFPDTHYFSLSLNKSM